MDVRFTDNSKEILAKKEGTLAKALEQCGLLGENYAKKNCPVDTGALRNSISHKVVLSEEAEFCYKVNDFYHPNDEGGMAWFRWIGETARVNFVDGTIKWLT